MKFRYIAGEWKRYALAAAGGLLLAAAFPKIGLAGLGWIAPGILLASGLGAAPWAAFRSGFVGGFAFFLAALYWLLLIPVPVAPIVGWLALSAFLSLYSGLWVWLVWRACPARFDSASTTTELLERFLETSWRQRFVWSVFAAVAWVAWEMTQARFLSGFPWTLLGASQYRILPLIQISSVTGVYGVSFLLVWFSAALLCACVGLARRPGKRTWSAEIFAPALVIVALIGWGMQRMKGLALEGTRTLRVALVQPSIPQTVIWNQAPEEKARRFASLMALSEAALTKKPALLVWPEAALPDLLRWSTNEYSGKTLLQTITLLARTHGVWMVVGADDAELKPGSLAQDEVLYYNSSFLISPTGGVAASYRKRRLVIFGEYVPLSRWLPFLKDFVQVYGEFTPGGEVVKFDMPAPDVQTAVLICFEDVFPHLTREYATDDLDFLLNLTNNGWFGEGAAQWQHAANAVFRSVENGVPLVRCANNGLTCWVDRRGGLHEVFFNGSSNIYKAGFKIAEVPLPSSGGWPATVYRRYGDWFGWSCVAVTGAAVAFLAISRVRKGKNMSKN